MTRHAASLFVFTLSLFALLTHRVHADEFDALRGRTIRIIVAHQAGNTTDTMARLFAASLKRLLPGTSVNIQNLEGNGGTLAMNEIHRSRGTFVTIGFVNSSVVFSQVTQGEQLPYDLNSFRWIGALASSQRVLVVRKSALNRADPRRSTPDAPPLVSLAATSSAQNYVDGLLLNAMTSIRLKMVVGFRTEQQDAMLLAGDADAGIGTYENYRRFIESGDLVAVLKFGTIGYPAELKNLPTLEDVASPSAPKAATMMASRLSDMGRYLVASPATTPAQTEALKAALGRILVDPAYQQGLASARIISTPVSAETVTTFMKDVLANRTAQSTVRAVIACGQLISAGQRASCQ